MSVNELVCGNLMNIVAHCSRKNKFSRILPYAQHWVHLKSNLATVKNLLFEVFTFLSKNIEICDSTVERIMSSLSIQERNRDNQA